MTAAVHTSSLVALDTQMATTTQDALVKMLLVKPQSITTTKLWSFLKKIELSRDTSDLSHFRDGVLVAEVINTYAPFLVTVPDLQRLSWECTMDPLGRRMWNHLGLTAFKQLCLQVTDQIVSGFERDDKSVIATFLIALFQKLDQYDRIQKSFSSYTRSMIVEHFSQLCAVRTFEGHPLPCSPSLPWSQGKTVVRLSNVDYQTTKIDVQRFLYPIIVDPQDIHIPVHLTSGKMTYTIYVMFDDPLLPMRAVDLHSGHTLLTRRVEIKVVSLNELLNAFYGRGFQASEGNIGHATATAPPSKTEWVTEETKERLLKLCRTTRNTFNGKTPERPFEHTLSVLTLLPWSQGISLSQAELHRTFELAYEACIVLLTFLHTEALKGKFSGALLQRFIAFSLTLPFPEDQRQALRTIYLKYLAGGSEVQAFLSLEHHQRLTSQATSSRGEYGGLGQEHGGAYSSPRLSSNSASYVPSSMESLHRKESLTRRSSKVTTVGGASSSGLAAAAVTPSTTTTAMTSFGLSTPKKSASEAASSSQVSTPTPYTWHATPVRTSTPQPSLLPAASFGAATTPLRTWPLHPPSSVNTTPLRGATPGLLDGSPGFNGTVFPLTPTTPGSSSSYPMIWSSVVEAGSSKEKHDHDLLSDMVPEHVLGKTLWEAL